MATEIFDPTTDTIDPQTGAIIKNGQLTGVSTAMTVIQTSDAIGDLVNEKAVPIHIAKMREYKVGDEVMGSYVNAPWQDVMSYIGKAVEVIGCAIWFSGVFEPQARPGTLESGYHKVLFKIAETRNREMTINRKVIDVPENIIIQTSGKRVAEMALVFLSELGWFDWPTGRSKWVTFGGNKDTGFLCQPIPSSVIAQLKKQGN